MTAPEARNDILERPRPPIGNALRTRIKICGITRPEDALAAARLGADAIGLVFHPRSPRYVELAAAREIVAALPPLVSVVALFMDPGRQEVETVLSGLTVDLLQFHGSESPAFCELFGRRYLKALPMGGGADPLAHARAHGQALGFLLDSHAPGQQGGSGETFDWNHIPQELPKPYLLAGGLHPGNVAEAVRRCRPYGVDVSSGVEAAKGIKDPAKLAAFINEVNRVGQD